MRIVCKAEFELEVGSTDSARDACGVYNHMF